MLKGAMLMTEVMRVTRQNESNEAVTHLVIVMNQ